MKKKLIVIAAFAAVLLAVITSCQNGGSLNYERYYSTGAVLYQSRCQNCHGASGEGLAGLIPPLTDSVFLRVNKQNLPCFINRGLAQSITISGNTYKSQMPAQPDMAPIEVAQVLTYIGNSFNNHLGLIDNDKVTQSFKNCR